MSTATARLGEELVANGIIPPGRVERALELQRRHGGRLGDILIGEGMVGFFDLYRILARREGLPFVDLLKDPPPKTLLRENAIADYLRLRLIPWRYEHGITSVAVAEVSKDVRAWIHMHYGERAKLVMTSPYDIRKAIEMQFERVLEKDSRLSLWHTRPHASARETFTPAQKKILAVMYILSLSFLINAPVSLALAFVMFCQICYSFTIAFKCVVFAASLSLKPTTPTWEQKLATLSAQDLPVYTILIPMYKEAASLRGMLLALGAMDYPSHKLDIKLVLESDDTDTLGAAYALKPSHQFEIIKVPLGELRTKPKACNYALRFARGEFVTVFDADDHPDPLQLKKAVYTFRNSPPDVVCLQARLNYYNADTNLLTRLFSLEYTILFDFMLPGLQRLGIPIPLGGTSNHISRAHLISQGQWDPFNVTEDADLGTRLAAQGYRTIMLDSTTLEEAPHAYKAWIRQRSRWIKGYMQTWLVHMRKPVSLQKTLGLRGFIGFQFFVGLSTFTYLSAPLIWFLGFLWAGQMMQLHHVPCPMWLATLTLFNMLFNMLTIWGFAVYSLKINTSGQRNAVAAMLYPLYLIMHSIASYKALWQLFANPHFWEKTTHGLAAPFARKNLERTLMPHLAKA